MPDDKVEVEFEGMKFGDMPLTVKIGIPVSFILALIAIVLERFF